MEQRWIPVSKRLPEDNIIRVWLSFTNQYASYVKSAFWNGSYFEHANGKKVKDKPTAWKKYSPPEPYKVGAKNAHIEKPQTNADRIRSMTDEELAIYMMYPNENGLAEIDCDKNDNCNCYECSLNWLRAESEG